MVCGLSLTINGNKTCAYTTAFRAGDDRRLMHLVVMLLQLVG